MSSKIIIPDFKIYTPSTVYNEKTCLGNSSDKYYKYENHDITINSYMQFPMVLDEDGSPWVHANLYLFSKLKEKPNLNYKGLKRTASDLSEFRKFCIDENINYLLSTRKALRPTWRYRKYLGEKQKNTRSSLKSLQRRMNSVIYFYEWLISSQGIKFKVPLWTEDNQKVSFSDMYGNSVSKEVVGHDIAKIRKTSNPNFIDKAIVDGGRLHPLSKVEQTDVLQALMKIKNIEMTLGFIIALTSGARIQTVFTLKITHFERMLSASEKEVRILVGEGTGCDTKRGKQYTIFLPSWVYKKVQTYIKSERAQKRMKKSRYLGQEDIFKYVFITSSGNPFYMEYTDPFRKEYRNPPDGYAIRQFIGGTLRKNLTRKKELIDFSFHDLRATFGLNRLEFKLQKCGKDSLCIWQALEDVRDRMGHESIYITEGYLKFHDKYVLVESAQDDYENEIESIING